VSGTTGEQTRKCTDVNNCGVSLNKPSESSSCTVEIEPVPQEKPEEKTPQIVEPPEQTAIESPETTSADNENEKTSAGNVKQTKSEKSSTTTQIPSAEPQGGDIVSTLATIVVIVVVIGAIGAGAFLLYGNDGKKKGL